jgi:type I restriction enzyme R subunit
LFIVSNGVKNHILPSTIKPTFSIQCRRAILPSHTADVNTIRRFNDFGFICREILSKCTLGEMISRYMVLVESEQKLLVMTLPSAAVKAINIRINKPWERLFGTPLSGKTLTSLKPLLY